MWVCPSESLTTPILSFLGPLGKSAKESGDPAGWGCPTKNWKAKQKSSSENDDLEDENNSTEKLAQIDLKNVTQFVDINTNLQMLLNENFNLDGSDHKFGIIGLHTCGNLAVNSMRIFLANHNAKFLANVGCCYHHLDEEFYRHPYKTDEENNIMNKNSCFPVSKMLRQSKFVWGRNARMMAAQPTNRMATQNEVGQDRGLY